MIKVTTRYARCFRGKQDFLCEVQFMSKQAMAIDEVIAEIEQLKRSPYVKLAKKTENQMLRQKLYQLRSLDKRGRKIAEVLGIEVVD